MADAGYGSDENYSLLEKLQIQAYVKYNSFDIKQSGKQNAFGSESLHYNEKEDCLYCPMGQKMGLIGYSMSKTASVYPQQLSLYQAANCHGCPLRSGYHKAKGNRIVKINHRQKAHKAAANRLLTSEEGKRLRKKRAADVEPVFANLKHNHGFKRFLLKGLNKTEVEIGLLSIAHNLRKWKA